MIKFPPPPTHTDPVTFSQALDQTRFDPQWLKWFVDLGVKVQTIGWGYGVFSDTTSQAPAVINTAYPITMDTTDQSRDVSLGVPTSRIVVGVKGIYNFQFSLQITTSSGTHKSVYIWPRVNGVDVPNSASKFTLDNNNGEVVPSWNFILPMTGGDYFELMWAASSTAVLIESIAATAFCPAIPSVILTVTQVNQ